MTIWVVRAGRHGETETRSLEEGRAYIGWGNVYDLSNITAPEEVRATLREMYPDWRPGTIIASASQLFNFAHGIEPGDVLAIPLKKQPAIAFGTVDGRYEYFPDNPENARHGRRVEWMRNPRPRNIFDEDIRKAFGNRHTVFRIKRNDQVSRIMQILDGK